MYSPSSPIMDRPSSAYVIPEHIYSKTHNQISSSYHSNTSLSRSVSGSDKTTLNGSSSSLNEHSDIGRAVTCDSTISHSPIPSLSSFDPGCCSPLNEHSHISGKTTCGSTSTLCTTPPLSSFDPGWRLYLSFGILSIVGLAASLDATSISPALPVSFSTIITKPF
jgi:hypothetical protein